MRFILLYIRKFGKQSAHISMLVNEKKSLIIKTMKLSIIVPVYNEAMTIREIVQRVAQEQIAEEIIIVDDGSTDGTREILNELKCSWIEPPKLEIILKDKNEGKGSAVGYGIQEAKGDVMLIQDADLEYDPREIRDLLKPILEKKADVVYGSRFLGAPRRSTMFWHMVANHLLTFITNLLYDAILTDMETGYKAFTRKAIEGIQIKSKRFNFEPEITAKLLKKRVRLFEVPISFNPRDYDEGKKIGLRDAFDALWALVKYRFVD